MSLHADALAVLREWPAPDAAQEQHRQRIITHLEAHPDGMRRDCFPAHVTAGALVVSADSAAVLLNLHGKAQRWFAFGGHCERADETLASVALREALEESGLSHLDFDATPVQLDEHAVPFCDPRGSVAHLDVRYVAVAPEGSVHVASDESLDVRWWPVDALPDALEDDMHALIALALARLHERRGGTS
ncbi:NUDIX domain-containing protein [Nocardioides sp. AE5]|uniref:NUDIX hydrolase n=1 Tax=Nocardioides sp. AE5 TaxID=2962573 RepID=UPI00288192FB|nr:NUDIX domain-containing protein [Nocardioides sp. AE5]MDT0203872.1 NUDIX domain-containing protein [Nocardioides sp. AE5]